MNCPELSVELKKSLKKKNLFFSLHDPNGTHEFPKKNFSQFSPAVWPAIANIYIAGDFTLFSLVANA